MATNKAGKFTSVVNTKAVWIEDHLLRASDVVNDEPTVAGATVKVALAAISALITASTSAVQTLSNKSLVDNSTFFVNAADNTKKINLDLSGFSTGVARVWTIPPFSGTVMLGGNYSGTNLSCGDSALAGGSNSVAFGPFTSASATDCSTFGLGASSSATGCSAFGRATLATAAHCTAAGAGCWATGGDCSAYGYQALASGTQTNTALGGSSRATGTYGCTAVGQDAQATGTNTNSAFGASSRATGQYACNALGSNAVASGTNRCLALGSASQATGADTVVVGTSSVASANGATALGDTTTAAFANSTAIGKGATTTAIGQIAIRANNSATTELRTFLTTDATARATLVTHLPIELNGVTYYIKLYQT